MSDRPAGYDALARMVMSGDLGDPQRVAQACEAFWRRVERWAAANGIVWEEPEPIWS